MLIGGNQEIIPNLSNYKDYISNINQFEAFRNVVGYTPDLKKKYYSLFRNDSHADCRYEMKNNVLYFVDNAGYEGQVYFSIFDVLKKLKGFSFKESCVFLMKNNVMCDVPIYSGNSYKTKIRFTNIPWKDGDDFIQDYGLSAEYMNSQPYYKVRDYWITTKTDNTFRKNALFDPSLYTTIAYHFKESEETKLYWYKGDKEKGRFYTNCGINNLFGEHRFLDEYLGQDTLWIVKSGKEDCILNYHLGLCTIGVQGETNLFPEKLIWMCEKFDEIIILYDNDETGKLYSNKRKNELQKIYPEKEIRCLFVPKPLNDVGDIMDRKYDLASIILTMYNDGKTR